MVNPAITCFDTSCFDGRYITGDITPEYLAKIEHARNTPRPSSDSSSSKQLDLNLARDE
jgi:amidophosphoribosyltransferase